MIRVRPGVLQKCDVHRAGTVFWYLNLVSADVMLNMMDGCVLSLGLHYAKVPSFPV